MMISPTSPNRQSGRRRWIGFLAIGLLAMPVVCFIGSNLWLQSRWGASWIEKQIHQRTGLDVKIGGAGWLPGAQIWIDDMRVMIPDPDQPGRQIPLLQTRCVSLRPAWRAWLGGSKKISDICVSHPRLEIPLHALQQLIPPPAITTAPVTPAAPAVAASNQNHPAPPAAAGGDAPAVAPSANTTPEPPSPTVWLKVEHGHLAITHPSQSSAVWEMENISSDLPIGGAPATGHVKCEAIRAMGRKWSESGHISLHWQYPLWESEETTLAAMNLTARSKFQLARLPGLPFSAIIAQEPQPWTDPTGQISLRTLQSRHQLAGYLLGPQTWNGESLVEGLDGRLKNGSHAFSCYLTQARFQLQGGLLQCSEFRWLGDELGVTANGMFSLRGEMLSQAKIIAPRATAQTWITHWQQLFPAQMISMQPVYNDDRFSVDALLGGSFTQPWLSFDQGQHLLDPMKFFHLWNQGSTLPPS